MNPANSCVLPTTLPAEEPGDGRIAQALQEYEAALKSGRRPDRQAFLQQHPEAAERIADYLDGLDFLHAAAVQLDAPTPQAPSSAQSASGLGELGDFRLMREVGRGGMGVVYEAEQISLGRRVALKVLPFAATMDSRQRQRFHNEARAAASLHHPHIVPVHAVGVERGVHFYAMQFIDGQSLEALIHELRDSGRGTLPSLTPAGIPMTVSTMKEPDARFPETRDGPGTSTAAGTVEVARDSTAGSLPLRNAEDLRRVVGWGIQAAEALEHAHGMGIVHRDVKPANLLLDEQGQLWVTDFGLARTGLNSGLTMTGDLLGTLRYMSPEQALAKHGLVDHRTDVYSLGATLHELLTLQPVFTGSDRQELLRQIAFEEPKSARSLNRAIPADLETIVLKAMDKNPADRYATAQELADDLGRFLRDEPIRAKRPTLWQRAGKWARRHRPMVAAAIVSIVGILLTAVAALAIGNAETRREEQKTKKEKLKTEEALRQEQQASCYQRIARAERELAANNIGRAEELLHECPEALRGWEWHYLKRRARTQPQELQVTKHWVVDVAISPNGRYLATASVSFLFWGEVKLWDPATGKELHPLRGHGGPA